LKGKDLTEHFIAGEEVYSGNFLRVQRDLVRLPDGNLTHREYIRHPGAVAVVPLLDDGHVLLVRQHRYPHRRDFIEIPAGKLEPDEPALETGKRELLEETGYVAEQWEQLGVIDNAIAYSDERLFLWLARGLTEREQKLDAGEFLEVLRVPFAEALAMTRDGRITDVKSIIGLQWASPARAAGGPK
jgi:ADP-ribose pyrophosphatase